MSGMHTNMNRYGVDGVRRVRELEAEVERLREQNEKLSAVIDAKHGEGFAEVLNQDRLDAMDAEAEVERLRERKDQALAQNKRVMGKNAAWEAEVKRLREDYAKLRDALEHVSESEDRLRAEVERLREDVQDLTRERDALTRIRSEKSAEVERLQRIVDSVQSKTALDVVAEKLQAQDDLRKSRAEVRRLRDDVRQAAFLFGALGHGGEHDRCDPCEFVREAMPDSP